MRLLFFRIFWKNLDYLVVSGVLKMAKSPWLSPSHQATSSTVSSPRSPRARPLVIHSRSNNDCCLPHNLQTWWVCPPWRHCSPSARPSPPSSSSSSSPLLSAWAHLPNVQAEEPVCVHQRLPPPQPRHVHPGNSPEYTPPLNCWQDFRIPQRSELN